MVQSLRDSILEHLKLEKGGSDTASGNISRATKDFAKSNAPQFRGKSQKKRHQMAVAAGLSAARGESAQPGLRVGEMVVCETNHKKGKLLELKESGMAVVLFADRRDPIIVRGSDLTGEAVEQELTESFMMGAVPSTYVEPSNYGFMKVDLRPEDIGLVFEDDDTGVPDEQEEEHDNGSNVRHDGHTNKTQIDNLPKPSDTISPAYSDEKPPKEQGQPLITEPGAEEEHLWDEPDWDAYDYPADAPVIPTAEFQGEDGGNARAPNYDNAEHQPGDGQEDREDEESINDGDGGKSDENKRTDESDHWIQGTHVDQKGHKGNLHRALHVPQGQKIGAARINRARHSGNAHTREMANMAHNMNEGDVTDPARDTGEEHKELNAMRKDLEFVNERQGWDDEQAQDERRAKGPDPRQLARRNKEKERKEQPWNEGKSWNEKPGTDRKDPRGEARRAKETDKKKLPWMDEAKTFFLEMDDLLGADDKDSEPKEGATITVDLPAMAAILVTCCHRQPDETTLKAMVEALAEVSKGKTISMGDLDAVAAHMNGEECDEMQNREEGNPDHEGIHPGEHEHGDEHEGGHHDGHESWPGDGEPAADGGEKLLDCGDPSEMGEGYYGGDDVLAETLTSDEEDLLTLRRRAFPNARVR